MGKKKKERKEKKKGKGTWVSKFGRVGKKFNPLCMLARAPNRDDLPPRGVNSVGEFGG